MLAFPSIFRGALDVRATRINEEMKLAACRAIAALARESTSFGRNYIIPMPLDSACFLVWPPLSPVPPCGLAQPLGP